MSFITEIQYKFKTGSLLTKLIIALAAVYVFQVLFFLFGMLMGETKFVQQVLNQLYFPVNFYSFIHKPWTLFTYSFIHQTTSPFHILFNLLGLYWYGQVFLIFLHDKKLLVTYTLGVLFGALCTMLFYSIFPGLQTNAAQVFLLGSSAGIMAVALCATVFGSDVRISIFFAVIPLKYITAFYVLMDILSLPSGNFGTHLSHLAGALIGYLYAIQLKKGNNIGAQIEKIFAEKRPTLHKETVQTTKGTSTVKNTPVFEEHQEKLDAILDKISESGYDSLTAEEKAYLFQYSKKEN